MDQKSQIQKTILDELGLSDLPQNKKEQLLIKMTEVLLKRIFLETLEKLSENGREEYESLMANGASPRQVEEFLKANIQNYEELVEKVIKEFKDEMSKDL